ncbi:MAG: cytochrome c peroxidase, partial [Planctomycetota bacterium]
IWLGQAIFWDEQLSSLNTMACATCHLPEAAGVDPRTLADPASHTYIGRDRIFDTPDDTLSSKGISSHGSSHLYEFRVRTGMGAQLTIRNTPLLFDAAYAPEMLLDGRAPEAFVDLETGILVSPDHGALESQAMNPFKDQKEMGFTGRPVAEILDDFRGVREALALAGDIPVDLASWLNGRGYEPLFEEAFGSPGITTLRIAQALATFERTLVTHGHLPFDHFLDGDTSALTPLERQGYGVFQAVGCADCHPGAILTDHEYRNIGLDDIGDEPGREFVTGDLNDLGKFRTITLRNVALTAPYFHDGSAMTLREAVEFFNVGGHYSAPNKDSLIRPLGLTDQQINELVAFLGRPLTDPRAANFEGPYARLRLYSESPEAPQVYGYGTAGTGGTVPKITLLEPTRLGETITVAVEAARPGAPAALLVAMAPDVLGTPLTGAMLHVDLAPGTPAFRAELATHGLGPGSQSIRITLPSDPALAGTSLFAQWLVFDPRPEGRLASSAAVQMRLFE